MKNVEKEEIFSHVCAPFYGMVSFGDPLVILGQVAQRAPRWNWTVEHRCFSRKDLMPRIHHFSYQHSRTRPFEKHRSKIIASRCCPVSSHKTTIEITRIDHLKILSWFDYKTLYLHYIESAFIRRRKKHVVSSWAKNGSKQRPDCWTIGTLNPKHRQGQCSSSQICRWQI